MQRCQGFTAQREDDGIEQLVVLRYVENIHPVVDLLRYWRRFFCAEDTVYPIHGYVSIELFGYAETHPCTPHCQDRIMEGSKRRKPSAVRPAIMRALPNLTRYKYCRSVRHPCTEQPDGRAQRSFIGRPCSF